MKAITRINDALPHRCQYCGKRRETRRNAYGRRSCTRCSCLLVETTTQRADARGLNVLSPLDLDDFPMGIMDEVEREMRGLTNEA